MFPKKDLKIISHLRNNARKKITHISKEMQIPVTTIYDRLRIHEHRGVIKKHVALLDFKKLGYETKVNFAVKAKKDSREELQEFLMQNKNVNSLSRINYGFDFLFEGIFKNFSESENFIDEIEKKFGFEEIRKFHVVEELMKEEFLTKDIHLEV